MRKTRIRYVPGRGFFYVMDWVTSNSPFRWAEILIGPYQRVDDAYHAVVLTSPALP